jgi:demethylmenaquinone methyltransferase/2-methoxy-6-polyprenyl-1,4-benzoquinol methylase
MQQIQGADKKTDFGYVTVDEDKKVERVREVFDSVAAKYDLLNDILSLGLHRLWKRTCVREAAVTQGKKVLDIASGTCDLAISFAKRAGDGNVVASDINHEMLAIGKHRMQQQGCHAYAVEADAENLPFEDNTFDVITVSFGIRNMTHKDRALREMYRVLRPKGKLIVLEFSKCSSWVRPIYDFYSFKFMPWMGGIIAGDAQSYRYLAESIRMHPDQPTFAGLMKDAGFDNVHWNNLTFGICAMHVGLKESPLQ